MVNDKMSDGIAALHLAAVNNCLEIANILIKSVSTALIHNYTFFHNSFLQYI